MDKISQIYQNRLDILIIKLDLEYPDRPCLQCQEKNLKSKRPGCRNGLFWPNNWGGTCFETDIREGRTGHKREWHLGLKETMDKKEVRETIGLVETVFEKGKGQKVLDGGPHA